jgi:hypothetical protein
MHNDGGSIMAINKIASPLSTSPSVFATPVVNQLLALAVDCNHGNRIGGGYVKKGSLWNIGGSMFLADSDTLISGTRSQTVLAIRFTVSGETASASYATSLSGVSWNGAYQGYYDASGNMYYYEIYQGAYINRYMIRSVIFNTSPQKLKAADFICEKTGSYKIVMAAYNSISTSMQLYLNGSEYTPLTATTSTATLGDYVGDGAYIGGAGSFFHGSLHAVIFSAYYEKGDIIGWYVQTDYTGTYVVGIYIYSDSEGLHL